MANETKTTNIAVTAREVDFVTRFANNWEHLRDILGIMRPIRRAPGTVLKSKYAEVTLNTANVAEGAVVPYSQAQVKEKDYKQIEIKKYAKAVTLEAINLYGHDVAVQMTDDQFLFELTNQVVDEFYTYIKTGTLEGNAADFQMALARAQGMVRNKFKSMHKGMTEVVGFCNILDAYDYLGAANITVQNEFGMNYIENFLGYRVLFLLSENEIPRNKVYATPVENIVLYYVAPSESDFAKAGLSFTTDGETNLIGVHAEGKYETMVTEMFAVYGMVLFAEYLDGIANITIGGGAGDGDGDGDSGDSTNP